MVAGNKSLDALEQTLAALCKKHELTLELAWKFLEGGRVYDIVLSQKEDRKVFARLATGLKKNAIEVNFHFELRWPEAEAIRNKFTRLLRSRAEKFEGMPKLPADEPGPEYYPFVMLDLLHSFATDLPASPLKLSCKLETADKTSLDKIVRGLSSIPREKLKPFLDRNWVCDWLLSEPGCEQTYHRRHFTGAALIAAGRIEDAIEWRRTVMAEMQREALTNNPDFHEILIQLDAVFEHEIEQRSKKLN